MSETSAHLSLVAFLAATRERLPLLAFCFHVANESAGGPKSKGGVPLDVLKDARMGASAGVWDFLFILPCEGRSDGPRGVAIELKSNAAYKKRDHDLSPAQVAWRAHYEACGWDCYVFPESRWHEAALLLVAHAGGDPADYSFS